MLSAVVILLLGTLCHAEQLPTPITFEIVEFDCADAIDQLDDCPEYSYGNSNNRGSEEKSQPHNGSLVALKTSRGAWGPSLLMMTKGTHSC